MKKGLTSVLIGIIVLLLAILVFTPGGRSRLNSHVYSLHKVDDATKYETLKEVENTCRAMLASYDADKDLYEQYIKSEDPEKVSWAESAKIRANRTASTYNNYILKNSDVWADNVPVDIKLELDKLE